MKIENEIEKSRKRISLLEHQNARFKNLLESALEFTKRSNSESTEEHKNEHDFWQETIKLIEDEKLQMQEDLMMLAANEGEYQNELTLTVKKLENENLELQKKVEVLLNQAKQQSKEMEKLQTEHAEFKFLLAQPDSNPQLLKNILQLDDALSESSSTALLSERYKLQRKIIDLEKKRTELITAIDDMTNPENDKKSDSAKIKSDLEKALFKAIDEVAKREFENLHLKVLDLENERSKLLNDLQAVLDESRKEIAEEYWKLQRKIMEIEKEKDSLRLTLRHNNPDFTEEDEEINSILDAFSNNQPKLEISKVANTSNLQEHGDAKKDASVSAPACIIL